MKKLFPFVLALVLGVVTSALARPIFGGFWGPGYVTSALGGVWWVNEMRFYAGNVGGIPVYSLPEAWTVSSDNSISQFGPSFKSSGLIPEPFFGQGRAWLFDINGFYPDGGFATDPWVDPTNTIFVLQNGSGSPASVGNGVAFDIYGNMATKREQNPGSADNNQKELWQLGAPVVAADGVLDYTIADTFGKMIVTISAYSYSVDGTPTNPGDTFDLYVTDGLDTATATLFCQTNSTTNAFTTFFVGVISHDNLEPLEIGLANTGNCLVPPTIRDLQIRYTYYY